ncbi:MAG: ABC transporter permease [Bacteroidales bacterium]|nr:ABC transporter permease [Bacteroidales bacterium]
MLGVAIGLAVMIIALAVIVGFKSQVKEKVIGFGSHIQISNFDAVQSYETLPIVIDDSILTVLSEDEDIQHIQRYATKLGMIKTTDAFEGVVLKGVGPEYDLEFLSRNLLEGEMPLFSDTENKEQALLSKRLCDRLNVKLGDKIYLYFMQKDNVRARRLFVKGIYETNLTMYDDLFLFTDIHTVNRLNQWKENQVSGVELRLSDYDDLEEATSRLGDQLDAEEDSLGGIYFVRNIEQLNPQIFDWLGLLDLNVWIILILMIGVAGFTVISGLLIIIIERTSMIGVLKALGATNANIQKIFLWLSIFLIGRGMIIGNVIGLGFCYLQHKFRLISLNPSTYYMDSVPIYFDIKLSFLVNFVTFIVAVAILVGPSFVISKVNPSDSIRFE